MTTDELTQKDQEARQWGLFLHLSQLAHVIVPLAGFVTPIVLWQLKKDEFPDIDAHGKNVLNWMISEFIYALVCIPLCFVFVGIPLLVALGLAGTVFAIVGGVKANNGEMWKYPMAIPFLK